MARLSMNKLVEQLSAHALSAWELRCAGASACAVAHTDLAVTIQLMRRAASPHFAHGFARARCNDCGHDYFVAYSCKSRGVCPSCNTRRMVETAAHLTDHVLPRLPVRQWVLSIPKRLRYFMQRDGTVLSMVLGIFLRVIKQSLQAHCPGAAQADAAALHIGASLWQNPKSTSTVSAPA